MGEEKICDHYYKQVPATTRGYKMDKECIYCKEKIKNIFPATTFEGFIRRWVHNKLTDKNSKGETVTQRKCGNYHANETELYYFGFGRKTGQGKDILAIKLPDGRIIGNASQLPRCGSYRRGAEAPAQQVMQQLEMALIPLNIFEEADLNLFDIKIIDQKPPETLIVPEVYWNEWQKMLVPMNAWSQKDKVTKPRGKNIKNLRMGNIWRNNNKIKGWIFDELQTKNLEKRHFIGAMVFSLKDKYYLFDVDRQEIKHYRFNAFLSELPKKCRTVEEAYNSLMPIKVKNAIKRGLKVKRQGEWFFIPTKLPRVRKPSDEAIKIFEDMPSPNNFDLNLCTEWNSNWNIKKESIDIRRSKINSKYQKSFDKRVIDYFAYRDIYLEATKEMHQADPDKYASQGELQAGDNRPNTVEKFVNLKKGIFVKGKVEHTGREHEPIYLKDWCIAIPNTAIKSFTIVGQID